jgi:hypothetical protein
MISGTTRVMLDVQDEDHEYADIADGDHTQLQSVASGTAQILWKEDSDGSTPGRWAVVRFPFKVARLFSEFDGCCLIKEGTPDDAFPDTNIAVNTWVSGQTPPRQWLMLHFKDPFPVAFPVNLALGLTMSATAEVSNAATAAWRIVGSGSPSFYGITEDFDWDGSRPAVGKDTWNDQPDTGVYLGSTGNRPDFAWYSDKANSNTPIILNWGVNNNGGYVRMSAITTTAILYGVMVEWDPTTSEPTQQNCTLSSFQNTLEVDPDYGAMWQSD